MLSKDDLPSCRTAALEQNYYFIRVTAVAIAAVATTATGGASLLTARAAADGLAGLNECMRPSTAVNSARAPAW